MRWSSSTSSVAGLQPVYYGTDAAWLTNDEANHRIALLALPGLKPPVDKPHSAGLHHTAFEYDSTSTGGSTTTSACATRGIRPFVCLDHGMTMSMYYQDPEGNGVEIQVDMFGTTGRSRRSGCGPRRSSARTRSAPQFDPEKVLAAYRPGAIRDEVHIRAYARASSRPTSRAPP